MLLILEAVKKIADDDELRRFEKLDTVDQPLHVFAGNRRRNRYPAFPEMSGFADVQIGYDEGLLLLPENRPVAVEDEVVVAYGMFDK